MENGTIPYWGTCIAWSANAGTYSGRDAIARLAIWQPGLTGKLCTAMLTMTRLLPCDRQL